MHDIFRLWRHVALWAVLLFPVVAVAGESIDNPGATKAITKQLDCYEEALNASDIDGLLRLYTDDAVVMPPNSPPSVGRAAVRDAYRLVFADIKLSLHFSIEEMRQLSPEWAYVRTQSKGTVEILSSKGAAVPEANQEMFLFHRDVDGQWRIARYMFSSTRSS